MRTTAVEVRSLSKTYRLYDRPLHRLMELATGRQRHHRFHALRDVSFELHRGEALGVLGENGAGKSTLLKILAGVSSPSSGDFQVQGKAAAILELGSGFHPEFTGRQNIRLNAAMLGLGEKEIEERTPAIIDFAELASFIDQPVKTYSTGMAMRLGFAIATQVEPDVLIIDEALSVGDGYFQKKCMDRMLAFLDEGGTLLFCSHALYYLSAFCRRGVWLRDGQVEALGETAAVIREYESFLLKRQGVNKDDSASERSVQMVDEPGPPHARFSTVRLDRPGSLPDYRPAQAWSLELEWECSDPAQACHLAVSIDRVDGVQVASFFTLWDGLEPYSGTTRYRVRCSLPELPLLKGEFTVYAYLMDDHGVHAYDRRIETSAFRIAAEDFEVALVAIEHEWERLEPIGLVHPSTDRPAGTDG